MNLFRLLKKLVWMPLAVAPLLGCFFFDDPKEDSNSWIAGFASDTTAILFSYNWETSSNFHGPGNAGSSTSRKYLDIELRLVDLRFKKTYWSSKVKNNYGKNFLTKQWNDSTIIFEGREYWLWAIGNSKPQQITLNWNTTEKGNLIGYPSNRWLRWENDSVVTAGGKFIIDTKTRTVNSREIPDCSGWWGKVAGGGGVLVS